MAWLNQFEMSQFSVQPINHRHLSFPYDSQQLTHPRRINVELNGKQLKWCPISNRLLYYSRLIGMPIVQVNGQRIAGPPHGYEGPIPSRGSEVFVGGVPRDSTEEELIPLFSRVGRIYQLRLMMDFSGSNRGYCFVQFYTVQEATNAIRTLEHYELRRGQKIGVLRSVDNFRLQLNGLPNQIGVEIIYMEMMKITPGLLRVTLVSTAAPGTGLQFLRSSAIIEYESHRAATLACRKLVARPLTINGFPITVCWAKAESGMLN